MKTGFRKIVIVGLGAIGGSIAMALKDRFGDSAKVYAIDKRKTPLAKAKASGLLADFADLTEADSGKVSRFLKGGEDSLIILATPSSSLEYWFKEIAGAKTKSLVTDVTSTKQRVARLAQKTLPDVSRFIPSHPMAGSEAFSFSAARKGLFDGATWVITPLKETTPADYKILHDLLVALGARVESVSPKAHDKIVAIISHLPHAVSSSLVNISESRSRNFLKILRFTGGGFRDTTRIAAGNPALWAEIMMDNKEALCRELSRLTVVLEELEETISSGDKKGLKKFLENAAETRENLPSSFLPKSGKLAQIEIPMKNRPGVIAEITSRASLAGLNIQSIEIDHKSSKSAVLRLTVTDEGDIESFLGEEINLN